MENLYEPINSNSKLIWQAERSNHLLNCVQMKADSS